MTRAPVTDATRPAMPAPRLIAAAAVAMLGCSTFAAPVQAAPTPFETPATLRAPTDGGIAVDRTRLALGAVSGLQAAPRREIRALPPSAAEARRRNQSKGMLLIASAMSVLVLKRRVEFLADRAP